MGANPDPYSALDPYWYQDSAHPNPRAAYAYVTALYQFITGRSVLGGPVTLAGQGAPQPSMAEAADMIETNQDGRLELFYTGLNNTLYHNYQTSPNGGWSGQRLLGTASNAGLELATGRDANNKIEVNYIGTDNKLYHNHQVSANREFGNEAAL